MLKELQLSLYIPNGKEIAHFAKPFPETGKIYIFCNRTYIKGSGILLNSDQVDGGKANHLNICAKCISALEATIERMSIIQGIPPPERFNVA